MSSSGDLVISGDDRVVQIRDVNVEPCIVSRCHEGVLKVCLDNKHPRQRRTCEVSIGPMQVFVVLVMYVQVVVCHSRMSQLVSPASPVGVSIHQAIPVLKMPVTDGRMGIASALDDGFTHVKGGVQVVGENEPLPRPGKRRSVSFGSSRDRCKRLCRCRHTESHVACRCPLIRAPTIVVMLNVTRPSSGLARPRPERLQRWSLPRPAPTG